MSLAAAGRMRRELCTSLICIDSCSEYNMTGRLFHASLSSEFYFRSFMELIEQLEYIFNSMDYPQSTMTLRSFEGTEPMERTNLKKPGTSITYAGNAHGKIATFRLRVMFRQNASWQGTVEWVEQGKEESFRSVLEFLHLMDSAIPAEYKQQEEFRTDIAI